MVFGSLKFLSFLFLRIHSKSLKIFPFDHLRKPTLLICSANLLYVLTPSQPSSLQGTAKQHSGQNSSVLPREESKHRQDLKSLNAAIGSSALCRDCKINTESETVSLPSQSSKWQQLLLFAKAVNEFPFLMVFGLASHTPAPWRSRWHYFVVQRNGRIDLRLSAWIQTLNAQSAFTL